MDKLVVQQLCDDISAHSDPSAAWSKLVACVFPSFRPIFLAHNVPDSLYEDVAQEVFAALWIAIGRQKQPIKCACNFILTLAEHKAVDHWRRNRKWNQHIQLQSGENRPIIEPVDEQPGPCDLCAIEEIEKLLRDALKQLPVDLREVLVRKELGDYTHEEIAQSLGIPAGTSKWRLQDAKKKLRSLLRPVLGASEDNPPLPEQHSSTSCDGTRTAAKVSAIPAGQS